MQRPQDIQRRGRGVEADAIADATVASRVVGQDQGNAFFAIGHPRQIDPAPRQFGDEIHAFRLWPVADHVRLTALTAPGQVLETDRPADDPPVQFRQRDVHRQVTRAEALFAGAPTGFVVLGANRLDHRNIAAKRPQMRRFGAGLGEAGGVENHLGIDLIQQVLDHRKAAGLFQTGQRNRQRVQPRRLQTLAENIDETRCSPPANASGKTAPPPPVDRLASRLANPQCGGAFLRVVNRGARQGLRLGPGVVAIQPAIGQAAETGRAHWPCRPDAGNARAGRGLPQPRCSGH